METSKEEKKEEVGRLALSLQETADSLGLSYITVWRLVRRGKIRAVPGIRHKLIPLKEIERFLNTVEQDY